MHGEKGWKQGQHGMNDNIALSTAGTHTLSAHEQRQVSMATQPQAKAAGREKMPVKRTAPENREPSEQQDRDGMTKSLKRTEEATKELMGKTHAVVKYMFPLILRANKPHEELIKTTTTTVITSTPAPTPEVTAKSTTQPRVGRMVSQMWWEEIYKRMHEGRKRNTKPPPVTAGQEIKPAPPRIIPEKLPERKSSTHAIRDIVMANYRKTFRIKRSPYEMDNELNNYLDSTAHLGNNIWYQHMKEVGQSQSEGECFVCALLSYSMGKSKIFVAVEVDVPTAHCMSHVAMCNTRGQFMGRDASLIWANEKDYPDEDGFVQDIKTRNRAHTKNHVIRYENPDVKGSGIRWEINSRLNVQGKTAEEAQIWRNPGQMQIWGSVVSPNGWEEGVAICRAWMVLGACKEAIENSQRLCKPLWPKLVKLLTWVEDRGGPLQIVPLENPKLCFRSNGTRKMGENQNCGRIYEAPGIAQGTAVLMDHYWACGSKAYIRLPKNWGGHIYIGQCPCSCTGDSKKRSESGQLPESSCSSKKEEIRRADIQNEERKLLFCQIRRSILCDSIQTQAVQPHFNSIHHNAPATHPNWSEC
ncbi:uncharacterized protein [Ambystoma mexicanum]|uniref:uncharacterized protein isoform X1 n=1 Tax=Ambystoma mexicanum TaxID=8296 RepID=UPI0037E8BE96